MRNRTIGFRLTEEEHELFEDLVEATPGTVGFSDWLRLQVAEKAELFGLLPRGELSENEKAIVAAWHIDPLALKLWQRGVRRKAADDDKQS